MDLKVISNYEHKSQDRIENMEHGFQGQARTKNKNLKDVSKHQDLKVKLKQGTKISTSS